MTVRQQIVEDRVEDLVSQLQIESDYAFLRLAQHLITGQSVFCLIQKISQRAVMTSR